MYVYVKKLLTFIYKDKSLYKRHHFEDNHLGVLHVFKYSLKVRKNIYYFSFLTVIFYILKNTIDIVFSMLSFTNLCVDVLLLKSILITFFV